MQKPKTLKSFLKIAIVLRDIPLNDLKGFEKLSEKEQRALGYLVADIANDMSETELSDLLKKFKLSN